MAFFIKINTTKLIEDFQSVLVENDYYNPPIHDIKIFDQNDFLQQLNNIIVNYQSQKSIDNFPYYVIGTYEKKYFKKNLVTKYCYSLIYTWDTLARTYQDLNQLLFVAMQIDKKSVLNFYLNMKKIIARMIGDTNTPYLILDKLELDITKILPIIKKLFDQSISQQLSDRFIQFLQQNKHIYIPKENIKASMLSEFLIKEYLQNYHVPQNFISPSVQEELQQQQQLVNQSLNESNFNSDLKTQGKRSSSSLQKNTVNRVSSQNTERKSSVNANNQQTNKCNTSFRMKTDDNKLIYTDKQQLSYLKQENNKLNQKVVTLQMDLLKMSQRFQNVKDLFLEFWQIHKFYDGNQQLAELCFEKFVKQEKISINPIDSSLERVKKLINYYPEQQTTPSFAKNKSQMIFSQCQDKSNIESKKSSIKPLLTERSTNTKENENNDQNMNQIDLFNIDSSNLKHSMMINNDLAQTQPLNNHNNYYINAEQVNESMQKQQQSLKQFTKSNLIQTKKPIFSDNNYSQGKPNQKKIMHQSMNLPKILINSEDPENLSPHSDDDNNYQQNFVQHPRDSIKVNLKSSYDYSINNNNKIQINEY